MGKVKIKPHRKLESRVLSNEQLQKRFDERKHASEILLKKNLTDEVNLTDLKNSFKSKFAKINFLSSKHFGDKLCDLLKTKILSDEFGRIDDILLTVPEYEKEDEEGLVIDPLDERHLKTLIRLLYSADQHRMFTLLCHAQQFEKVSSWFSELHIDKSRYTLNVSIWNYSIWAQDAYVALTDENENSILCEGVHFPRVDDPTVADDIAAQTDKSSLQSYLYFQGGNILDIGDYVLVGKDYIIDNTGRAFLETEDRVIKAFENLFGKTVISVGREQLIDKDHRKYLGGGYFQPIFHIDMYITPTGKKNHNGKPIVFVGSPKLARQILNEESCETDYDVYFDETEEMLSQYFEIKRLPLLPCYYSFRDADNVIRYRQYYLSYNNALIENYEGKSNVYLPTFSQDVTLYREDHDTLKYEGTIEKRIILDNAAKKIWEDLGYNVHQMDGLEDLAMGWGSVHCITKTLKRAKV